MAWIVAELPKDMNLKVSMHRTFENAVDEFMDRYNEIKSAGGDFMGELNFDKAVGGYFKSEGITMWLTEAEDFTRMLENVGTEKV